MFTDLITIAIPVFERVEYFEQALRSATEQTLRCPVVVVDNASSHNLFESIAEGVDLSDISYIRNVSNIGMEGNWNACIKSTNTKWITILHDDDILYPKYIETVSKIIEENVDVACVAVRCGGGSEPPTEFNEKRKEFSCEEVSWKNFLTENLSPFPGVAFQREIGLELGGFNADWHPCADLEFWCRFSENANTVRIDNELAFYRISNMQGSFDLAGEIADKTYLFRRELLKKHDKLNAFTNFLIHDNTYGTYEFYASVYNKKFKTEVFDPNRYSLIRRFSILKRALRAYAKRRLL